MVLALLVVASLQRARFPGGWITIEDLRRHTPIGDEPENIRRALDRALEQFGGTADIRIAKRKLHKRTHVRLTTPVSPGLSVWLRGEGREFLLGESWQLLIANAPTLKDLDQQTKAAFDEACILRWLAKTPTHVQMLDHRAVYGTGGKPLDTSDPTVWCHVARMWFHRVEAALQCCGPEGIAVQQAGLETHLSQEVKSASHECLVVEAQASVMVARCIADRALMANPEWPLDPGLAGQCREWLESSTTCRPSIPAVDRGYAYLVQGLLCINEGSHNTSHRDVFDEAERLLGQALYDFHSCRHLRGVLEATHYQSELAYQRWATRPGNPVALSHEVRTRFNASYALLGLTKCDDLRIIEGVRMAIFTVVLASYTATALDRAKFAGVLAAMAEEVSFLRLASIPKTDPYVKRAEVRLREFANAHHLVDMLALEDSKEEKK